jgi:hypothetical protein
MPSVDCVCLDIMGTLENFFFLSYFMYVLKSKFEKFFAAHSVKLGQQFFFVAVCAFIYGIV